MTSKLDRESFIRLSEAEAELIRLRRQLESAKKALEVDANDIWEDYAAEVSSKRQSPQGALAFAVSYLQEAFAKAMGGQ